MNEQLINFSNLMRYGDTLKGGAMHPTRLYHSYQTWAYKKIFGAFNFKGFPDTWDYDYFMTNLFMNGFIAICDTPAGVLPLECGIAGVNVFDRPTRVVIGNPVLGSFEKELESDIRENAAALVRLQYDYMGVRELVNRYASMLSQCDNAIFVNLRNSKVSFIGFVQSKQQAATMQKMYKDIDDGKPAVYVKKDSMAVDDIYYNHVKDTYIANDLELLKDHIKDDFLTEIGLNNANTEKRERLIVDEVNANNYEIRANVQHWLDTIKIGLERANYLFNLDLSVELRKFDSGERSAADAEDTI